MALRKRIWRMIKESKSRYIAVLILIFLGSFIYVLMSGIGNNSADSLTAFSINNVQEDFSFRTDRPIEDIDSIENKVNAVIEPYHIYDAPISDGLIRFMTLGSRVNIPIVTGGDGLHNSGDILVDPSFKNSQGLQIGDTIQAAGHNFTLAGTFSAPHYVYALQHTFDVMPTPGFGIALISFEDFAAFTEPITVYAVHFNNRYNIPEQTGQFNRLIRELGYTQFDLVDAGSNRRIQMPWASITGQRTMAAPTAVGMFFISCLIVGILIWRIVKSDSVIIGTFYAQGYRKKELMRHYMAIPIIIGLLGGLLGTILAVPAVVPSVTAGTAFYNIPIDSISVSPVTVVVGVLLPTVFLGIASFFVVNKVLDKKPAELMKGDSDKTKINFLERTLRLNRFSFNTKFKLREQMRSIPRLIFLFLGVSVASMLMIFGFTLDNSMRVLLDSEDDTFSFSREYSFISVQHGDIPEGAEPFNAIKTFPVGQENIEFYTMGIDRNSTAINLGSLPLEQVNITAPLARRLRLGVGDTVEITDRMLGYTYTLTIDGIVENAANQFIFMPIDEFNAMTNQQEDSYTGLFSDRVLNVDSRILSGIKDTNDMVDAFGEIAVFMTATVVVLAIVAGLIGIIIIFLVTSLIIEESRGTISLLKIFGYRSKELGKLLLNGTTVVVIAGFLLGIPMMLAMGNTMYGYLGDMVNLVLPMIVVPWHILISFVLIFGVYEFTKRMSAKKIKNIPMSEALKAGKE